MKSRLLQFVLLACIGHLSAAVAQTSYRLPDYMPSHVGDAWQYKNFSKDGLSPIINKVSAARTFRGRHVMQRDENNGDYRLQSWEQGKGLFIHHLYFIGDRTIDYEAPVLLMPAQMRLGASHKSAVKYSYAVKGEVKERGVQTYEVTLEKIDHAVTPLQSYNDCLVLRTVALRRDESGSQKGYDLREWYARGVGAVKVVGELYWKNAAGATTRVFKIDAALEQFTKEKPMTQLDPNKVAHTLAVGTKAFGHFRHGLAKGEWQAFLDLLTDDFTFYFPQGKYQGEHQGKDKAKEFFAYVSSVFTTGITINEVLRVSASETNVVFEFRDEGVLREQPYKNRVAVSFDVRGDKISGYREYFGSDGKSN
jgi:ketosteroid isomerase-like protein